MRAWGKTERLLACLSSLRNLNVLDKMTPAFPPALRHGSEELAYIQVDLFDVLRGARVLLASGGGGDLRECADIDSAAV